MRERIPLRDYVANIGSTDVLQLCHYFTHDVAGSHCSAILERLNDLLPSSLSRIHCNLASVLSLIHASPESPAWDHYLQRTEHEVTEGLVCMVLTAVGSLLHRAHLYEQV